ncbi:acid protease [Microthyrium microscopicum]|uniref:Acid protease n=1 Tax=Microthyrium microscopicum TaxID=703497 RepID=A0A6A6U4F7_9PEZI|nr:acid protease [Microthyrium microscopicum]
MGRKRPTRRATQSIPAPIRLRPSQKFDGDDGQWSTFIVGVGTPPQNFRVLPASQISETYVTSTEGCISSDPSNCYSLRGGEIFNSNPPAGFLSNQSSTWDELGLYGLTEESTLDVTGNGDFGTDVISLNGGNGSSTGDGVSLAAQVVAAVPDKDYFLGSLGLSQRPPSFSTASNAKDNLLDSLYEKKLIPSRSFSYTAGAYYGDNGKNNYGSLVLGGYDSTRLQANKSLSIHFGQSDSRPIIVGVQSIIASDSLNGTASMTSGTNGHLSLIDSSVPHIWLPRAVCDNFASNFGLFYDVNSDLYIINSTMHAKWNSTNPTFTFKIGSTATDNGNGINIILPYKAFDVSVAWPIYASTVYNFPIRRAANDSQYVLGRTFLQQAHITVDYDRQNFTIAAAIFPDTSTSENIITIKAPTTGSSTSKISTGAIAGIVIGAIALLILAIGAFLFFRKRKRSQARKAKVSELDARDSGINPAYAKVPGGGLHEAGGDEVHEVPGSDTEFKQRAGATELDTVPPVFELPGENNLSPYSQHPSPYRTSQGSLGVSSPGTATGSGGPLSPTQPSPMHSASPGSERRRF